MSLQLACTDFRALKVLQDAEGASFAVGGAAEALDVLGVIRVGAMGEIEAGNVHAEAKQVAHSGLGVAGWTDGTDDFGATMVFRWSGRVRGVVVLIWQFLPRQDSETGPQGLKPLFLVGQSYAALKGPLFHGIPFVRAGNLIGLRSWVLGTSVLGFASYG